MRVTLITIVITVFIKVFIEQEYIRYLLNVRGKVDLAAKWFADIRNTRNPSQLPSR